ncbi:MAG TPA: FKBP-type peptidyl-prolyl cis-trans isomerase, partial [Geobacteraceae bacterium]|nr:FKBP-type peptidyl-prolyl cis-trans isomerase [Geobacteraceae bacterium]
MAQVKNGDTVQFHYVGKLDDGTVFDSTYEGECADDECSSGECTTDDCGCEHETGPMQVVIGAGEFFPVVEEALIGMAQGEKKTVTVKADDAFGEYDETRVFTVPLSDLPEDFDAEEGDELILSGEDDEEIGVCVIEKTDAEITFDANHP